MPCSADEEGLGCCQKASSPDLSAEPGGGPAAWARKREDLHNSTQATMEVLILETEPWPTAMAGKDKSLE